MVRHFYSDGVFAEAQRKMRWFHDRPEMRDQSGMAEKYYHNRFFSLNQHLLRPQVDILIILMLFVKKYYHSQFFLINQHLLKPQVMLCCIVLIHLFIFNWYQYYFSFFTINCFKQISIF